MEKLIQSDAKNEIPVKSPMQAKSRYPTVLQGWAPELAKRLMDLVHDLVHNATMQVNIHQTKTHLSKLLQRVAAGEEIIIAKAGVPIAKLVPMVAENAKRQLGLYRGQIWMAPDFDGPLPDDVLASFYGDEPSANRKKPVGRESKKSGSQKRKR
jgi:prevent-host-death family protein